VFFPKTSLRGSHVLLIGKAPAVSKREQMKFHALTASPLAFRVPKCPMLKVLTCPYMIDMRNLTESE